MAQAKTLKQSELDHVLEYVSKRKYPLRDRAIILTSFLSGLRVGEIAALHISDVVADDGSIKTEIRLRAEQTKGAHPRTVFVSSRLREALATYHASRAKTTPDLPFFHPATVVDLVQMASVFGSKASMIGWVSAEVVAIAAENSLSLPWPTKASGLGS